MYILGVVSVEYFSCHVGHDDDVRTHRLTNEEKSTIISQISAGVSFERVVENARNSTCGEITRYSLITRQDIHNIISTTHIKEADLNAVTTLVNNWNSNDNDMVFLFKNVGKYSLYHIIFYFYII